MEGPPKSVVTFTLNGDRLALSAEMVDSRLAGVVPEFVRKHAVKVNGSWYPVMQAFEAATGVLQRRTLHRNRSTTTGSKFEPCSSAVADPSQLNSA